jgi:hypothetical protein
MLASRIGHVNTRHSRHGTPKKLATVGSAQERLRHAAEMEFSRKRRTIAARRG